MDEEGEEEEGDRDNMVEDEEEEGDMDEDEEEEGDMDDDEEEQGHGDNMGMKQEKGEDKVVVKLALYVIVVNQLVSPQLFTACEEGRVEDVVQLLSSGVGANVTDKVSKVCVQVCV